MTDVDTPLMEQIFDVPQGKWKPNVKHYSQSNDLRARFEITEGGALGYERRLVSRPAPLKQIYSDNTDEMPGALLLRICYPRFPITFLQLSSLERCVLP